MRIINKARSPRSVSIAGPGIAIAIALPLFWLSYRLDFLPVFDFIWRLGAGWSFAAKQASGYALSIVGTALLVHMALRLTGADTLFRVGRGVLALTTSALFLPTALAGMTHLAFLHSSPLSFTEFLFYERNRLMALSSVLAGAAILLALLGSRFEFHWYIQRRSRG